MNNTMAVMGHHEQRIRLLIFCLMVLGCFGVHRTESKDEVRAIAETFEQDTISAGESTSCTLRYGRKGDLKNNDDDVGKREELRVHIESKDPLYRISGAGTFLDAKHEWVCREDNTCELSHATYVDERHVSARSGGHFFRPKAISRAACIALMHYDFNITVSARAHKDKGILNPLTWERVASASTDKKWRAGMSTAVQLPAQESNFHIFYLQTPPSGRQASLRSDNVKKAIDADPESKTGAFEALLWDDWETVRLFVKAVQLPTMHITRKANTRGNFSHWASLLLSIAYAVQFELPYLVLLGDDVRWPSGPRLRHHLVAARLPPATSTLVVRLGKSSEGYVFPLAAARHFLDVVYARGVCAAPDVFLKDYMEVVYYSGALHSLLMPNDSMHKEEEVEGNVYSTPPVNHAVDFLNFDQSQNDAKPLTSLLAYDENADDDKFASKNLKLFATAQDRDFHTVVTRLARNMHLEVEPLPLPALPIAATRSGSGIGGGGRAGGGRTAGGRAGGRAGERERWMGMTRTPGGVSGGGKVEAWLSRNWERTGRGEGAGADAAVGGLRGGQQLVSKQPADEARSPALRDKVRPARPNAPVRDRDGDAHLGIRVRGAGKPTDKARAQGNAHAVTGSRSRSPGQNLLKSTISGLVGGLTAGSQGRKRGERTEKR